MLLGRDAELKRLDQVLDARQSALVLITSGPQLGKTSLLEELRRRAEQRHYRVFPTDETATVIDKQTNEPDFRAGVEPCPGGATPAGEALGDAPDLLLIEGYRPLPRFERWFTNTFLAEAKAARLARIVVVAAYPDDVTRLFEQADHVIALGPVDQKSVASYLREQSERASFPLSQAELFTYEEALSKQPALIGALGRLLELERTGIGGSTN
jgi:hypothetical protein